MTFLKKIKKNYLALNKMPIRRKPRRKTRKRRTRRMIKSSVRRPLLGNSHTTTLRYYTQAVLNPGAGTLATWVLSANGAYDPDITFGGHQPRGFDQLMPLYDHYCVLGSKLTVQCASTSATEEPVVMTLALRDSVTLESQSQDYIEGRNCVYTLIEADRTRKLNYKYSARGFFAAKDPVGSDKQQGTIGSNPVEQGYYHISLGAPSGTDVGSLIVTVLVEYIVKFVEPKQPTAS